MPAALGALLLVAGHRDQLAGVLLRAAHVDQPGLGIERFGDLVAHGAEDCVRELRRDARDLERLSGFKYKEPNGRDQGINVRQKSQTIVTLPSPGTM